MVFLISAQEDLVHPLLSATTPYSYTQHWPSLPSSTLPTGPGSCDLQKALNLLMRFLREVTLHLSNHAGPTWCSSEHSMITLTPESEVRKQAESGVHQNVRTRPRMSSAISISPWLQSLLEAPCFQALRGKSALLWESGNHAMGPEYEKCGRLPAGYRLPPNLPSGARSVSWGFVVVASQAPCSQRRSQRASHRGCAEGGAIGEKPSVCLWSGCAMRLRRHYPSTSFLQSVRIPSYRLAQCPATGLHFPS